MRCFPLPPPSICREADIAAEAGGPPGRVPAPGSRMRLSRELRLGRARLSLRESPALDFEPARATPSVAGARAPKRTPRGEARERRGRRRVLPRGAYPIRWAECGRGARRLDSQGGQRDCTRRRAALPLPPPQLNAYAAQMFWRCPDRAARARPADMAPNSFRINASQSHTPKSNDTTHNTRNTSHQTRNCQAATGRTCLKRARKNAKRCEHRECHASTCTTRMHG